VVTDGEALAGGAITALRTVDPGALAVAAPEANAARARYLVCER